MPAHQQLHRQIPYTKERRYFGLSRPENGPIVYRAAAEELIAGEGRELKFQTLIIPMGNYYCIGIKNFVEDPTTITAAFAKLLALPDIDPQGYCVEEYLNDKYVRCMVRMI